MNATRDAERVMTRHDLLGPTLPIEVALGDWRVYFRQRDAYHRLAAKTSLVSPKIFPP
ncbi:MAG: hypothetical protein IPO38_05000 [Rhodocyclaceae bacterium]|nr:hypothetical protein [Rhodocyclaceae bacterium]